MKDFHNYSELFCFIYGLFSVSEFTLNLAFMETYNEREVD